MRFLQGLVWQDLQAFYTTWCDGLIFSSCNVITVSAADLYGNYDLQYKFLFIVANRIGALAVFILHVQCLCIILCQKLFYTKIYDSLY